MDYGRLPKPGEKVDENRLMEEVQHTLRAQIVQEFYQTVRDKCFKLCITSPGTSLSSSDQKCLSRCMDRYQDATNIVTKAVINS
ncbi:mitochondrial inner membrane translocase, partial [Haematococcus lacustris]